ncbi:MAG: mandelate racemase/muconate lactonizing enzyme family protein, partial [Alphaproteobacteria bacterium]|nr:mandelate racemase/muconate lactonizing enzyme family protein [Alphaproteobacteria bacterium]
MIIERVETIPIRIPLAKDFGGSVYHVTSRATVVTRLYLKDGRVAEVYNGDNRDEGAEVARLVAEDLAPLVVGADMRDWRRLHQRLWDRVPAAAMAPKLLLEAIACLDTAVWDALGRLYGVSVARLMGGAHDSLPIISIAGYYEAGKTLDDLGAEMRTLQARGMGGAKVKVGGLSAEADAERVAACREAAGPDFLLAVDANRGWGRGEAIRFARLVEHLDIAWFEEPCHWFDDARAMAEVRQATSIPINAGQSEITPHGIRRLIESGAVDIVNFDASEAGGPTAWAESAALCRMADIAMSHHEEPQIALHLLASTPNAICVECFADPERDPIWPGLLLEPPLVADGRIHVDLSPKAPSFIRRVLLLHNSLLMGSR